MKNVKAIFFPLTVAFILSLHFITGAHAQSANTIWIESGQTVASAGESVKITVKATSNTPFQGLKFKLSYDPACLQPSTPKSLLTGLNYLPVPQTSGMVDAIFAGTTPLNVNGAIAEVNFTPVGACQTVIQLQTAGLVAPDASGMPVDLQGLTLGATRLEILTGASAATGTNVPQATIPAIIPATLPAEEPTPVQVPAMPKASPQEQTQTMPLSLLWVSVILGASLLVLILIGLLAFRYFSKPTKTRVLATQKSTPALYIQRGHKAGSVLQLAHLPCRIGSDPVNDIHLEDANVAPDHAIIRMFHTEYVLVDLGSPMGTYLNGKPIHNTSVELKPGDVLRLGNTLMVFGTF